MHELETIESRSVFAGRFFEVFIERFRRSDGAEVEREIVRHPGAVAVVPVRDDGSILMVRQGRAAVSDKLLELPAGKLEADEDPWECAKRELLEETGYRCGHMELLSAYFSTPGFSDERVHVFLGSDLEKVQDPPDSDGDEPISIEWLGEQEALEAIFDSRIVDAKTIIGIALLKLRENPPNLGETV